MKKQSGPAWPVVMALPKTGQAFIDRLQPDRRVVAQVMEPRP